MNEHLISFHEDKIIAFNDNGKKLVAIKPICEILTVDWSAQRKKIMADNTFNSDVALMTTTGSDGKRYEMTCIPLELFPLWLAKINPSRLKSEKAKEKILLYQKEAAKVLYEYFFNIEKKTEQEKIAIPTHEYIELLKKHIWLLEAKQEIKKKRRTNKKLTKEEIDKILQLHKAGRSLKEISEITGRGRSTISFLTRMNNYNN
jgi:hypothetical protein